MVPATVFVDAKIVYIKSLYVRHVAFLGELLADTEGVAFDFAVLLRNENGGFVIRDDSNR